MSVSKKGVSTIIATVVLILLCLIAIFLLWFFLRPTIVGTEEKLGTTADCINVRVEPVKCNYYRSIGCDGTLISLTARRAAGIGDYNGLKLLFTKEDGTQFISDTSGFRLGFNKTLKESEYGTYGAYIIRSNLSFENPLNSVNLAVLVGEDKKTCNPLAVQVPCTETPKVSAGPVADCNGDNTLDLFDYLCFVNKFSTKDTYSDFNNDGVYDVEDYFAYCGTYDAS